MYIGVSTNLAIWNGMKLHIPLFMLGLLPRKYMVSILRKRMIKDFVILGFNLANATETVDKMIKE